MVLLPIHAKCILRLTIASVLANTILSDDYFTNYRNQRTQAQQRQPSRNFYRRQYSNALPTSGVAPDNVCSLDTDCAGYPLSFCDAVCRCVSGALNAGTTCIAASSAVQQLGTCPPGQTYISEAGACMTVQSPGEPCQYSQQCAVEEPGAFCLSLKCECVYGMHKSGTGCTFQDNKCTQRGQIFISEIAQCKEVIPPGGQGCSHSMQCSEAFPGAFCLGQTCTCPPTLPLAIDGTCGRNCPAGHTYSGVTGQCLPTVQPGEKCLYTSQCHALYAGTVCDRSVCRCPNQEVFYNGQCVLSCPQGQRISATGICSPSCTVAEIEFDGNCLPLSRPNYACQVNAQCTGGSSCQNEMCTCPRAMAPKGDNCMPIESPPLGPCSMGETCIGGSFCSNGNCTCPHGRQIVNGICVTPLTVDIGGTCVRVGSICLGGSICAAGNCVCPLGTTPTQDNTRCVELREVLPGESCARGEQCTGGSFCNEVNQKCECTETKMVIGNRCEERLRSHPGFPCSNNELCVGGSTCQRGKCTCPIDKVEVNKVCIARKQVPPGSSCRDGEDCMGGSECDYQQKKCICRRGQQILDGRCVTVSVVSPGASCTSTMTRCGGGSYCVRGRCECPESLIPEGSKCVPQKKVMPGSACTLKDNCIGHSVCRDGMCQCTNDMVLRSGVCERKRKAAPGESCRIGDDCMGGSACNGDHCECDTGKVIRGGICQERRLIKPGYLCLNEDVCIGLSVCIKGTCQCKPGYRMNGEQCIQKQKVLPGGSCVAGDECTAGTSCKGGYCVCPQGHALIAGVCKEIVKVLPGQRCARGDICEGGSFCDANSQTCKCVNGEEIVGTACVKVERRRPTPLPVDQVLIEEAGLNVRPPTDSQIIKPTTEMPTRPETASQILTTRQHSTTQPRTQWTVESTSHVTSGMPSSTTERTTTPTTSSTSTGPRGHPTTSGTAEQATSRPNVDQQRLIESNLPQEPKSTAKPGFWFRARQCLASNQCPSGAECVRGECQCMAGLALTRFGFCIPINYVDPGQPCVEGESCRGGAECKDGMCVCPQGLYLKDNHCRPASRASPPLSKPLNTELTECPEDGSCRLPDCFCSSNGQAIPGGFNVKDIPQMVILSFDDPITDRTINIYKSLFSGKHRNPNGCPIKGTFFVSHQWNNYDQTQWVHSTGNEIAVNSITHETLRNAAKDRWRNEIVGLRDSLQAFSYVDSATVKGVRAPQLLIGGDEQFETMKSHGFTYDNSMPIRDGPLWPQTLDHKLAWDCGEQRCPRKAHAGLWMLPLQMMQANDGIWHTMASRAVKPYDSKDSVRQMLRRNFFRNYKTNRAPFVLTADTDFLTYLPDNGVVQALDEWLQEILNRTDVYVVTASQAIEWMKTPTALADVARFRPWQCNFRMNDHVQPCETPSVCTYPSHTPTGLPYSFRICGSCPKAYPWIEDPLGKRQLA